jgi:hypothetical protein
VHAWQVDVRRCVQFCTRRNYVVPRRCDSDSVHDLRENFHNNLANHHDAYAAVVTAACLMWCAEGCRISTVHGIKRAMLLLLLLLLLLLCRSYCIVLLARVAHALPSPTPRLETFRFDLIVACSCFVFYSSNDSAWHHFLLFLSFAALAVLRWQLPAIFQCVSIAHHDIPLLTHNASTS